jgi:hypothetical protein
LVQCFGVRFARDDCAEAVAGLIEDLQQALVSTRL